jgi:signal transduction histidine kinase
MPGTPNAAQAPPPDASRAVVEFVHNLLSQPAREQPALEGLLAELAAAFSVPRIGLAAYPEGTPLSLHPALCDSALHEPMPAWREQPDLLERLIGARLGLTVPRRAGGSYLIALLGTPERGAWLLWLEDPGRTQWCDGEAAALVLAGQALTHCLTREDDLPCWAEQLDRGLRRQRLEAAASLVRRLAHDFGNVLTGILGFSELALAQPLAPSSPLHAYLKEIHRGAQNGAHYTNQLRLFAGRHVTVQRSCDPAGVLGEEERRLRPLLTAQEQLRLDVPDHLPAVALEGEALRQVLGIVLDNARDALGGAGVIEVSARTIDVDDRQASALFGDVRPGVHLEIRIADSGAGLSPEARRRLFAEPFFSTKPRNRGFGLALAYGLLSARGGGLELLGRPQGGTIARLVLPVGAASRAALDGPARLAGPTEASAPRSERAALPRRS